MSPSIWQILIVVVAVFLLFGAGRLPRIMGDLAEGIKSFKKGMKEGDDEEKKDKTGSLSHDKTASTAYEDAEYEEVKKEEKT